MPSRVSCSARAFSLCIQRVLSARAWIHAWCFDFIVVWQNCWINPLGFLARSDSVFDLMGFGSTALLLWSCHGDV